jgi:hypothetical protein
MRLREKKAFIVFVEIIVLIVRLTDRGFETFAAILVRGPFAGRKTIMSSRKTSAAETSGVLKKSERALCKKTLEDLKQLGLDVGPLFFPQLLKTFERDAVEHLIGLRVAIAGDEPGRPRGEARALKGGEPDDRRPRDGRFLPNNWRSSGEQRK